MSDISSFGNSRVGFVVKVIGKKTVKVCIPDRYLHGVYGKVMNVGRNYSVHCENISVSEGDMVRIVPSRPISKTKSWRVVDNMKNREVAQ